MKVKSIIVATTTILIITWVNVSAQYNKETFGFSIGGGANYFIYKQPSLDSMLDSYNEVLKDKLVKKLEYLRPTYC